MSIEAPLFQALGILDRNPQRCTQTTFEVQNAGCSKLNQKLWSCVFRRKQVEELKNFQGWVIGSLKLHKQQFQLRFPASVLQTVGGFSSSSDASSESGGDEKNEIMRLSLSLPNEAQEVVKGSGMGATIGGPQMDDGEGLGGSNNGQGGKGKGKNTGGFGGSEGGNEDLPLRGLEWWWWWQWKRAHTRNRTRLRWAHNEPLRQADSMAQEVAKDTMKSLAPGVAAMAELIGILGLDQFVISVLMVPFLVHFMFHIHDEVPQMTNMTIGAVGALLAVAVLGLVCWCLVCCWNCEDNGNDSSDENSDLYL